MKELSTFKHASKLNGWKLSLVDTEDANRYDPIVLTISHNGSSIDIPLEYIYDLLVDGIIDIDPEFENFALSRRVKALKSLIIYAT